VLAFFRGAAGLGREHLLDIGNRQFLRSGGLSEQNACGK
jgi:hypothetical protein